MKLSKFFVDKTTAQERYNICKTCEHFNENLKKCNICGCIMPIKVKISLYKCPIDKWSYE